MKKYLLSLLSLFAITTSLCNAQTKSPTLWGMTFAGGAPNSGDGYIFKTNDTGTVKYEHQFGSGSDGHSPESSLMKASNGLLYGTTGGGGVNSEGIIFSYNISTGSYADEYNFSGYPSDGSGPAGPLMQASNGFLYGMTTGGGANVYGTIYSYDINTGKETDIYDFGSSDTDGKYPEYGTLIQVTDSLLYGMVTGGGANNQGIIFSYNLLRGIVDDLHDFINTTGDDATGTLIQASNNLLYGTTQVGGGRGDGVMFSYNISTGVYTDLHDFGYSPDGIDPDEGALIQVSDSDLYGMTIEGGTGTLANGIIFRYNIYTSDYKDVHDFGSSTDGQNPYGSLMQANNGLLYGTTQNGGVNGNGIIFSFNDTTNTETDIHDFAYNDSTGDDPDCSLIEDDSFVVANIVVWPGDANDDLSVNIYDLLSLGLYYDQSGPARDTTNDNTWAPHPAANWGSLQYNGYDLKYADCNGDGIIDLNDTLAILLNYGDTHLSHSLRNSSKERSGGVPLYFIADSASYNGGSNVHVAVWLGNSTTQATNIYGLGYDIAINTSLIQSGTLAFNYDNSFMGIKNSNALSLSYIGNDVETAVVGTDHTNKNGYGKIGDLYFTLNSSITNPQFLISVSSWLAVDAAGDTLALQPESDTLNVATGINQLSVNSDQLSIYPNPTSGQFTINVIGNQNGYLMEVYNMMAEEVYQSVLSNSQNTVNLNSQPAGMYFIYLKSQQDVYVGKVMVIK